MIKLLTAQDARAIADSADIDFNREFDLAFDGIVSGILNDIKSKAEEGRSWTHVNYAMAYEGSNGCVRTISVEGRTRILDRLLELGYTVSIQSSIGAVKISW